jgi:hypothetical protein
LLGDHGTAEVSLRLSTCPWSLNIVVGETLDEHFVPREKFGGFTLIGETAVLEKDIWSFC